MGNKILFSNNTISNSLSKGNCKISCGANGPTHVSGFYNIKSPSANGYVFSIRNNDFVETDCLLFLDSYNKTSYRSDLSFNEWWDLSGNNNDFNLYNGISYNSTYRSLDFNGSNDYCKTTDVIVSSPTSLTIGGWFMKKTGGSTYECVLHQSSNTSIGGSSYWFGVDNTDHLCATIGATAGVGWSAGNTTTVVTYDTWYYLVATWDGSIVKVYINGNYNKQYNLGTYTNLTTPTRIGASSDGTTYQFCGEIGQVFIYSKDLSSTEISQMYNASKNRYGL